MNNGTNITYNRESLLEGLTLLSEVKNDLIEIRYSLLDAIDKILDSKGFDTVEIENNIMFDEEIPTDLLYQCNDETEAITAYINDKMNIMEDYLHADDIDKPSIIDKIKTDNITITPVNFDRNLDITEQNNIISPQVVYGPPQDNNSIPIAEITAGVVGALGTAVELATPYNNTNQLEEDDTDKEKEKQ